MALTSGTKLGPYETASPLGAGRNGKETDLISRRTKRLACAALALFVAGLGWSLGWEILHEMPPPDYGIPGIATRVIAVPFLVTLALTPISLLVDAVRYLRTRS